MKYIFLSIIAVAIVMFNVVDVQAETDQEVIVLLEKLVEKGE